MQQLLNIASVYRQTMSVPIEGSTTAMQLTLEFNPVQFAWFMSLTWGAFVLNSVQMVAAPNLLRQWKNVIPFGLAVLNTGKLDPLTLEDFTTGVSTIYILNASDVAAMETMLGW